MCEKRQKNFLIEVVDMSFFDKMQSPIAPNIVARTNLARYGRADTIPAAESSKPRTLDTNLGPTVIIKYKPQRFPKCRTIIARNGNDVQMLLNGGRP